MKIYKKLGISNNEVINYGTDKFKVDLSVFNRINDNPKGNLILVTAISPTGGGEGKTMTSIGLAQGFAKLKKSVALSLREPSLGPVFGLKGGATGGGKSCVIPEVDINIHFTGDFHAITSAHNLLSALIDNHIFHGNELGIKEVVWKRAIDINDRSLRTIETKSRKDGFIITSASEIMAILALSKNFNDLRERLENILIGYGENETLIRVRDLKIVDSLLVLLKDAIKPNIVETTEKVPAIIHMGPFANVAHGCSSVLATKLALLTSDYTITEAGFGADLGMEKFLNIKMPILEKNVDIVVLVVTVNSIKIHGDGVLENGFSHVEKHINNIKLFGVNYVVAINSHITDQSKDVKKLTNWLKVNNHKYSLAKGFSQGGRGMIDLAKLVLENISNKNKFISIYDLKDSTKDKIFKIANKIYGADEVIFSTKAKNQLEKYEKLGFNELPICMAKTPLSFSGDAKKKGVPKNFDLEIEEILPSLGAGFLVVKTKGIILLPGLNKEPNANKIKIDDDYNIEGVN